MHRLRGHGIPLGERALSEENQRTATERKKRGDAPMKQTKFISKRSTRVIVKHDERMKPVVSVIDRVRMRAPGECCFCGEADQDLGLVLVPAKWPGKRRAHWGCTRSFAKDFDGDISFWATSSPIRRRGACA